MIAWFGSVGHFWYRFVIGDDWTVAAAIGVGLLAVYVLLRSGYGAWWLMPLVVTGALFTSLWRARRRSS
jgi:hypothetical protein